MSTLETNKFEIRLEETLLSLQNCQKERNLASCSPCEQLLNCPTRQAYIQAVYDSMSKGETGGFEF